MKKQNIKLDLESFLEYYNANDCTANGKPIKYWTKYAKTISDNGVFTQYGISEILQD